MTVPFLDLRAVYVELKDEIDAAMLRVADSGWYVLGKEVAAFEAEFAAYCGVKHCVGLGNGLEALELTLRAWDIGPGDEVIVPSSTYIATWLAATACGARVVPVEPDVRTANLDPERVAAAITPRTRAIIPVHLYGQPADMDPVMALAERHGVRVLEDVAQAQGARYKGRRAGALAHAGAFSFFPSKNLGALGDAGAVTTDDATLADRLRTLRNYGSKVKYVNLEAGVNSRLDELQAAVLRAKLPTLDAFNDRRRALAARYLAALAGIDGIETPHVPQWADPVWHLFTVRCRDRKAATAALDAAGIGWLIHYPIPPHLQRAYAGLGLPAGSFPLAERIADTTLSLPIGPHMPEADVDAVAAALRRAA
ncbi:MAG: DegT/DnrJ/EryC1/StrS family aminotransferase [Rhodospirillales bacterium]|nr:DegT/DnrJ/EryC1/StrS family aminotransferase [Rhodospirillales bacterium]